MSAQGESVRLLGQAPRRVADNPYVFPSLKLVQRPLEGLRGPWERAKKLAGLPADLRIHDLRHSLASALANAGTPLYEIGAVLGHSQLSTTTRYAHHSPQPPGGCLLYTSPSPRDGLLSIRRQRQMCIRDRANAGTPLYEIGAVLGHSQLSTTTRYAHHSPQPPG